MQRIELQPRTSEPAQAEQQSESSKSIDADLACLLGGVLAQVRWVVLAALVILSLVQPLRGRIGIPIWALILMFVGYNLVLDLLRRRTLWLRSFTRIALLDLPLVALLYTFSATTGGPLFVLFLLITACAAASMPLLGGVLYTLTVALLVALIAPTLPLWSWTPIDIRELGVNVIIIALIGVGTALFTRRLTQEQRAAEASRAAAARLEEIDRLRTEFVATISHELRTPLTAAKAGLGMLETSAADRLEPNEQRLLQNARRNIDRLDRHINDLLALNQIKAGVLRLERERLDLRTIISNALSVVHPLIRKKDQALELDLPEPLPLNGDPWRLEQVAINLLCNAYEHTPPGTCIRVSGQATSTKVLFAVSDTGPGIPPEAQADIFERFRRLDGSVGGSGLGLAIVKGVVGLHGGRIWVESEPGQGATFHVALPKQVSPEQP
jgi:signal transduction histidine kinase